jgi:hypothetical protein
MRRIDTCDTPFDESIAWNLAKNKIHPIENPQKTNKEK